MTVTIVASACIGAGVTMSTHEMSLWTLLGVAGWLCLAWIAGSERAAREREAVESARQSRLAGAYRGTTTALASAIAAKDSSERLHVVRVRAICEMIARRMGLDEDAVEGLRMAALVHDVGKLGVPEYILLKPGPLDHEEYMRTSNHAAIGAEIISEVDYPWDVAGVVRHHHERYDGTGYPGHLSGDSIPLGARILAVAEVYDSLTSEHCYRPGWPHQEAIEHIEQLSGTQFDPEVVKALVAVEAQVAHLRAKHPGMLEFAPTAETAQSCAAADAISRASQELMSIFEIAESLSGTLELDQMLSLLAHRARRLARVTSCVVFLADEADPECLTARAVVGRYEDLFRKARATFGEGMTGRAASEGVAMYGSYDPTDLQVPEGHAGVKLSSCLVAPMMGGGKLLGTINLYDSSEQAFTAEHVRTMTVVAGHAALAIHNARAFERVRDTAMKDSLTGLYNARYLRTFLEQEISRAARRGEVVTLLGMDLENFKGINDTFGHGKGDEVLRQAADVFRGQVRDYDLVARVGGDEFVVVLPGTDSHEARLTGDRIRRAIDDYAIEAMHSLNIHFGVSIGMASYPEDADGVDSLLVAADAAMYQDKRARKNRLAA